MDEYGYQAQLITFKEKLTNISGKLLKFLKEKPQNFIVNYITELFNSNEFTSLPENFSLELVKIKDKNKQLEEELIKLNTKVLQNQLLNKTNEDALKKARDTSQLISKMTKENEELRRNLRKMFFKLKATKEELDNLTQPFNLNSNLTKSKTPGEIYKEELKAVFSNQISTAANYKSNTYNNLSNMPYFSLKSELENPSQKVNGFAKSIKQYKQLLNKDFENLENERNNQIKIAKQSDNNINNSKLPIAKETKTITNINELTAYKKRSLLMTEEFFRSRKSDEGKHTNNVNLNTLTNTTQDSLVNTPNKKVFADNINDKDINDLTLKGKEPTPKQQSKLNASKNAFNSDFSKEIERTTAPPLKNSYNTYKNDTPKQKVIKDINNKTMCPLEENNLNKNSAIPNTRIVKDKLNYTFNNEKTGNKEVLNTKKKLAESETKKHSITNAKFKFNNSSNTQRNYTVFKENVIPRTNAVENKPENYLNDRTTHLHLNSQRNITLESDRFNTLPDNNEHSSIDIKKKEDSTKAKETPITNTSNTSTIATQKYSKKNSKTIRNYIDSFKIPFKNNNKKFIGNEEKSTIEEKNSIAGNNKNENLLGENKTEGVQDDGLKIIYPEDNIEKNSKQKALELLRSINNIQKMNSLKDEK